MEIQPVSHARARIAIQRLINSHFHNDNRARCSIPADPENDDDLVAMRYTMECEAALAAQQEEIDSLKDDLDAALEYQQKESEKWNSMQDDLEAENAKLQARLDAMSAPVSDDGEVWEALG